MASATILSRAMLDADRFGRHCIFRCSAGGLPDGFLLIPSSDADAARAQINAVQIVYRRQSNQGLPTSRDAFQFCATMRMMSKGRWPMEGTTPRSRMTATDDHAREPRGRG